MAVRWQLIRKIAAQLVRQHCPKGPPVDPHVIARAAGARVIETPTEADVSGFLLRRPHQEGIVIGVNRNEAPVRRRFTLAHELGHLLLHATEELHVDPAATIYRRSPRSAEGVDDLEKEANAFAAELLMPSEFLTKDPAVKAYAETGDDRKLDDLAKKYGVSSQAMSFRLVNLRLVSA